MATHPNRSKKHPQAKANPSTFEIRSARLAAGMTEKQAAEAIHCTEQGWIDWESGARRMHPAFFELFRMKTAIASKLDAAIGAGIAGDPDIFALTRQARALLG